MEGGDGAEGGAQGGEEAGLGEPDAGGDAEGGEAGGRRRGECPKERLRVLPVVGVKEAKLLRRLSRLKDRIQTSITLGKCR